jgi:hypothetical protein
VEMCPDAPTETPDGPWSIERFSQGNPAGPDQGDIAALLRRVADTLDAYGAIRVQDIVLHAHADLTADGYWPSMTVYFHRPRSNSRLRSRSTIDLSAASRAIRNSAPLCRSHAKGTRGKIEVLRRRLSVHGDR